MDGEKSLAHIEGGRSCNLYTSLAMIRASGYAGQAVTHRQQCIVTEGTPLLVEEMGKCLEVSWYWTSAPDGLT